ncbi:MAG: 6,7-dimethyl-8-ribityllumazine synthase [Planctomycetota bacterium]|nr:MAG: 6,7-dimethyl-8-ribityllumazine synthase [Planctomycetota bacterium]
MIFEGLPNALPPGTRVGIAVARWNEPITRRLLAGAVHRLEAAGLPAAAVDVAWVPGSFELPLAADRLAATGRYAAILCLGAIIKGETSHDHHIATATAAGIEATARGRGLPVIFGVLTCNTLAQAMVRAGGDAADGYAGNKGAECAAAAAEMVALLSQIVSAGGRS